MAIGYACLTIGVPQTDISRCTLKKATPEHMKAIIEANIVALDKMIDYNSRNNIKLFRICSEIIPFASHEVNQIKWWELYQEELKLLGTKIKGLGIRVSMHPGQYTVLNSPDSRVVHNAMKDLVYHERFLSSLGMDHSNKLVLHIGGVYGNKAKAMKSFVKNYSFLPQEIKNRLIIENDDKNYHIEDVLVIHECTGVPVVFDNLHHKVNPPLKYLTDDQWIKQCKNTWRVLDGTQKIHYSQQKAGGALGSHSDTIKLQEFVDYYSHLSEDMVDIMLEVKDKNLSAIKCINTVTNKTTAKELEVEWERYKYLILSRSGRLYQEIEEMLKEQEKVAAMEFYQRIETALTLVENAGAEVNAAQHIWGYFSVDCSKAERNRYEKLLDTYQNRNGSINAVKNHLLKCAKERENKYLVNSLYFYI